MANSKGNAKNLTSWKQGESGNPKGRPKNPPELKMIQKLKKGDLTLLLNRIFFAGPEELDQFNSTVIEKWIARSTVRGIEEGDLSNLFNLLDRLLGKTTPYFEEPPEKEISEMNLEEKKEMLKVVKQELVKFEAEVKRQEDQAGVPTISRTF